MARRDPMPTPLWLTDTNYPAPCFCGEPSYPGEALMMLEDDGLKRIIHVRCLPPEMMPEGGMMDYDG